MNNQIIKLIENYISYQCSFLPHRIREDVTQDIYLKLCEELVGHTGTDEEKAEFCIIRIKNYKKYFANKYNFKLEVPIDGMDQIIFKGPEDYNIRFDIDNILPHLKFKQKKLLFYLLNNGVEATYSEIQNYMGYKNVSMGMWAVRLLFQKIRNILDGNPNNQFSYEDRYLRHRKDEEVLELEDIDI